MLDAQLNKTYFQTIMQEFWVRFYSGCHHCNFLRFVSRLMASKSEAFYRERSRSPVTKAKADEPQDLEIVLEPPLPDSQEPPAVFDPLIERIIFNAVADNHMAALRGLPQIDIEALRKELESIGNNPAPVSE